MTAEQDGERRGAIGGEVGREKNGAGWGADAVGDRRGLEGIAVVQDGKRRGTSSGAGWKRIR